MRRNSARTALSGVRNYACVRPEFYRSRRVRGGGGFGQLSRPFSDDIDMSTRATGVGDLVLSTDGSWMVRPPEFCANRHQLAGNCIVSTQPCQCQDRHMSWSCNSCGQVTYGPALGPQCNLLDGPAWVQ